MDHSTSLTILSPDDETCLDRQVALATLWQYLHRAETLYLQTLVSGIERHSPELTDNYDEAKGGDPE